MHPTGIKPKPWGLPSVLRIPDSRPTSNLPEPPSSSTEDSRARPETAGSQSGNLLGSLPPVLRTYTADFLTFREHARLGRASKALSAEFRTEREERVKKDPKGIATGAYPDPACRKDRHVPAGPGGFSYLADMGILNPALIKKIRKGEMTIQQTLDHLAIGRLAVSEKLKDETLTSDQRRRLQSPVIQQYIANALLTVDQALALSEYQKFNLGTQCIRKYLANGLLSMDQALELASNQWGILLNDTVQRHLDNGSMSMENTLKLTDRELHILALRG